LWTAGFFVVVTVLIGVEFADRLVPRGWRPIVATSAYGHVFFKDGSRRRLVEGVQVSWGDEIRGGVAVGSWARIDVSAPVLMGGNSLAGESELAKAEAEDAFFRGTAVQLPSRGRYLGLIEAARASPGGHAEVLFPERRIAANLMVLRSGLGLGPDTVCTWSILLAVWCVALFVKWSRVLRPRFPDSCASCGYDRAGLATDAVCPECGKTPT